MASTSFGFEFGDPRKPPQPKATGATPLRIVVIGDFSGRASRGEHAPGELASRRLVAIDLDTFDDALARLAPTIHVPLGAGGEGVAIACASLDDFHPDALYDRLEVFASLRAARRRLQNTETFAAEAARLRAAGEVATPPPVADVPASGAPASDTSAPSEPAAGGDLFSQVLAASPTPSSSVPAVKIGGVDLSRLVDEIVAPYVLPKADPQQKEYVAAVDDASAGLMRRLLHDRRFQAVEAAWRQLWRVTKALTGDGEVRLFLLDATRAELADDLLAAGGELPKSGAYRLLVEKHVQTADGQPWGALVVLERFGRGADDCRLAAALGAMASLAGGPLLADAAPDVVGLPGWHAAEDTVDWRFDDAEAEKRWAALRASPLARSICLAAPRPLVRLPYGKLNVAERFAFEEIDAARSHEAFLWGSAGLAIAELIGLAFRRSGWSLRPGEVGEIDDLPAFIYEEHGEKLLGPTAEAFLSDRVADALSNRGVTPVLSFKNRHAALVRRLHTLAEPPGALPGPWQ